MEGSCENLKLKQMICGQYSIKDNIMYRTVYTPGTNHINVSIPDSFIGMELEIPIFPTNEVLTSTAKKKTPGIDTSFGGWADKKEEEYISKEELLASIDRGFRDVRLMLDGKKKTLDELIDKLRNSNN
jgi:hypothetical protein